MALLHKAQISPSKLELLAAWLPTRPWFTTPDAAAAPAGGQAGGAAVPGGGLAAVAAGAADGPPAVAPERVAAARFDDPDGQVGIEIMLVRVGGGDVWHVPLTYRGAPLDGADAWLIGTTDHSVLGERWVYDAVGDPVYVAALTTAIREAGGAAAEELEIDGERVPRQTDLTLTGSGADVPAPTTVTGARDGEPAVITTDTVTLTVNRLPTVAVDPADAGILTACWPGQETPIVLAALR